MKIVFLNDNGIRAGAVVVDLHRVLVKQSELVAYCGHRAAGGRAIHVKKKTIGARHRGGKERVGDGERSKVRIGVGDSDAPRVIGIPAFDPAVVIKSVGPSEVRCAPAVIAQSLQ